MPDSNKPYMDRSHPYHLPARKLYIAIANLYVGVEFTDICDSYNSTYNRLLWPTFFERIQLYSGDVPTAMRVMMREILRSTI